MYRKGFFKGWYYKQEKSGRAVAFIPAFHLAKDGKVTASIQVITEERAWNFDFPGEAVRLSDKRDTIQIGNNYFSPKGFRVNLTGEKDGRPVKIEGRIAFGSLTPLKGDIMGPFRFIPFLQCRHGVVSMCHKTKGSLLVDGDSINFHGGRGYVEKDSGCSFPSYYFWSQCGWYDRQECSVMVSVADIPLAGAHFPGCIAFVYFGGKEYRLATYRGGENTPVRGTGGSAQAGEPAFVSPGTGTWWTEAESAGKRKYGPHGKGKSGMQGMVPFLEGRKAAV